MEGSGGHRNCGCIVSYAGMHPCRISDFAPETGVAAAEIDWSGITADWSAEEGFRWRGNVRAEGFNCSMDPTLGFEFGDLNPGEAYDFVINDVPPGQYALVVILFEPMGTSSRLVSGENNVPRVIELSEEHGLDVGLVAVSE